MMGDGEQSRGLPPFVHVKGFCAACGTSGTLFVGKDGHLTCSWERCSDPMLMSRVLEGGRRRSLRQAVKAEALGAESAPDDHSEETLAAVWFVGLSPEEVARSARAAGRYGQESMRFTACALYVMAQKAGAA